MNSAEYNKTDVEETVKSLPFSLITHCPVCGEAYNITRYEVQLNISLGHPVSHQLLRVTLADFDDVCLKC